MTLLDIELKLVANVTNLDIRTGGWIAFPFLTMSKSDSNDGAFRDRNIYWDPVQPKSGIHLSACDGVDARLIHSGGLKGTHSFLVFTNYKWKIHI